MRASLCALTVAVPTTWHFPPAEAGPAAVLGHGLGRQGHRQNHALSSLPWRSRTDPGLGQHGKGPADGSSGWQAGRGVQAQGTARARASRGDVAPLGTGLCEEGRGEQPRDGAGGEGKGAQTTRQRSETSERPQGPPGSAAPAVWGPVVPPKRGAGGGRRRGDRSGWPVCALCVRARTPAASGGLRRPR